MSNVGEADVTIVGDVRDFARQAEKDLNKALSKVKPDPVKVEADTEALSKSGVKAGEQLAEGVKRGADGRLRNARGQFVKQSENLGESMGDGAGRSFASRFGRRVKSAFLDAARTGAKGFVNVLGSALSGAASAVVPIVSGVATLVGGTFIAVLGAVLLPAILGIVSAAVTALAGIGVGIGLIGLGALALKEVKPLQNAFKDLQKTLKDVGKAAAQPLLDPLLKGVASFKKTIKDLQPTLSGIFTKLAPAVKPLADALGGFVKNVLGGIKDSMPGIVAALAGFGRGLEWAGKVLGDFFRTIFSNSGLIDNTTEGLMKLVLGPLKLLGPMISGLNVVFGAWNNIIRLIAESNILGQIADQILAFVDGGTGALARISAAWGPLAAAIQNVWDKIKAFAGEDDAGKLMTRFQEVVQAIKDAWGPLGAFLKTVWDEAIAFLKRVWEEQFVPWWNDTAKPWLEEAIKGAFEMAWNAAKGVVAGKINEIRGTISRGAASFVAAHRNGLANLPSTVGSIFLQVNARIGQSLRTAATAAGNGARNIVNRIRSALQAVHSAVVGAFAGAAGWLISAGRNIMNGLVSGIEAGIGRVRSALNRVTDLIPDWKGPASVDKKLLRRNGQLVMQGFQRGLLDERTQVQRLLGGLTNALPDWSGGSTIASAKTSAGTSNTVTIMPGAIVINGSGTSAGTRAAEAVLARLAQAATVR